MKFPILFGIVVALVAANVYLFMQVNKLKTDLTKAQTDLSAELDKVRETTSVTTQSNRRTVESLRDQLQSARRQAAMAAGEAKIEALKKVDETRQRLESAQAQAQAQVKAELGEVKQAADVTNTKVAAVGTEVSGVKTEVATTKSQLEKTVADLHRMSGDLDGHGTLIATNAKELSALRTLGERNYIEFTVHRSKEPQKVGDVFMQLKKADPKRNRYTIELKADDKTVEKKDRTVNEPLQFMVSKARQPYEIVVNDVRKDEIVGYLAVPKVLNAR
jgi:chromosome segregation ATPase